MLNCLDKTGKAIAAEKHRALQDSHDRLLAAATLARWWANECNPVSKVTNERLASDLAKIDGAIQQARKVRTR